MTARRDARGRRTATEVTHDTGEVPRPLTLGCCVDVWAEDPDHGSARYSARRRYTDARNQWLATNGVTDLAEQQSLIPHGSPWTLDYLTYHGQAERAAVPGESDPLPRIVAERFTRSGATTDDLEYLRHEAEVLIP